MLLEKINLDSEDEDSSFIASQKEKKKQELDGIEEEYEDDWSQIDPLTEGEAIQELLAGSDADPAPAPEGDSKSMKGTPLSADATLIHLSWERCASSTPAWTHLTRGAIDGSANFGQIRRENAQ